MPCPYSYRRNATVELVEIIGIGKLELMETYAYYDEPVLFSCKNAAGHHYLAVAVDENGLWLYIGISAERLNKVCRGEIDLHDAFAVPEDGFLFEVSVSDNLSSTVRHLKEVEESMLPLRGEFLNLEDADEATMATRKRDEGGNDDSNAD